MGSFYHATNALLFLTAQACVGNARGLLFSGKRPEKRKKDPLREGSSFSAILLPLLDKSLCSKNLFVLMFITMSSVLYYYDYTIF